MKTLKRYIVIASLLLMAGALIAACSTQEMDVPSDAEDGLVVFTSTVSSVSPATKVVDADGKAYWAVNEKILVYYQKNDNSYATATANVDAVNAGVATITATLDSPKNGSTVKFVYPASLANTKGDDIDASKFAVQHGTISDISANFNAATGSATLVTSGSSCGTESQVNLESRILIGKFFPAIAVGDGGVAIDGVTSLTINDGTNTYNVTPASGTFGTSGIYVAMLPMTNYKTVTVMASTSSANYYYAEDVKLKVGQLYNNLVIPMTLGADLSYVTSDYTAHDGETLKGTLSSHTLTIADGAKVTFNSLTVNPGNGEVNALVCEGDAEIVSKGSSSLVNEGYSTAVIKAGPAGSTLTFSGSGTISVKAKQVGWYEAAVIGADKNGTCGNIVITDGTLNVSTGTVGGMYGAVIGAGRGESGKTSQCGNITISGGTVVADNSHGHNAQGAGIGSGCGYYLNHAVGYSICGTITISGGKVTAKSSFGAAIGSGSPAGNSGVGVSKCGDIIISGGTVDAISENTLYDTSSGAAIGAGAEGVVESNITISGGTVTATGSKDSAGIGTGRNGTCGAITITSGVTKVTATKGSTAGTNSIGAGVNGTCGTVSIEAGANVIQN